MLRWKSSLKPAAAPSGPNDNFEFTVTTTTSNETFTIPCQNLGTFNATVDWGDGSATSTITAYNDSDLTHTYATAGDHDISISGTFPNIQFSNAPGRLKVKSVTNLGSVGWISFYNGFYDCRNMTSFTAGDCDTSSVTTMHQMFANCSKVTSLDVSSFDTSSVTNMLSMFSSCYVLTSLDVSSFNTSSVTNMGYMFSSCRALTSLDLSSFNTSSVTSMSSMFSSCFVLPSLDLSSFNTSNVTSMQAMFNGLLAATSVDVSSFNTTNVTRMDNMFASCRALTSIDVSGFNTSNVTNMDGMFNFCEDLTSLDLSNFNTSKVTNFNNFVRDCSSLTSIDLSSFNTSLVVDGMSFMFDGCSSLTSLDLSSFNTSNLRYMRRMFYGMGGGTAQLTITGLEDFDITSLQYQLLFGTIPIGGFHEGLANTGGISTTAYDELLVNWEAQTGYATNINAHFGPSKYTASSAAATARASLVSTGWTITDGGTA